jgi:hydrogenase nickel incorporation protein HypA/HybF
LIKVDMVELEIGVFSGVQVDALQFALKALTPKTTLKSTDFVCHTTLLKLYCHHCNDFYIADPQDLICPHCLKSDFKVITGCEMLVKSIHGETS